MRLRTTILTAIAALTGLAAPAWAQVESVSAAPERTAVVIYRDRPVDTAALIARSANPWERLDREGLALIVETRTIDLPAGEAVIRFRGVATGIVPQTATLDGLPAQVVERNTDFDLLSPGSLLQHSVGEVVRVVRTNPETGEQTTKAAIVRSGPSGTVLEIDGRLEALDCSGLTERIIFDRVPEGLGDQPVLSVRTRAPEAGRYTVTLAYLATGLQWSADYVARLNPDGRSLSLTGWITLANFGGTGFRDSPVQVVAGTLNRDADTVPVDPPEVPTAPRCWPQDTTTAGAVGTVVDYLATVPAMSNSLVDDVELNEVIVTGSRIRREDLLAEQGELGDYKIYTLPERTDVSARQTKQVRFLEQDSVRFTRIYRERISVGVETEAHAPRLLLRLRNRTRDGLGMPLPGGGVALMETQAGRTLFTGQSHFEDRGIGLPVELEFGAAMDLTVSHTMERTNPNADRIPRFTVTAEIRNDKPEAVEIEIAPAEFAYRGFRIVSSDAPPVITEGGYPAWRLRVPPGGGVRTLTYTFEFGG
ncbi:MAG: hypothetical protein Q8R45_11120 [Brevundimonas sp.]|uniref:DUF4139 domain-containing protein n=1 Tax=Brevundimonas sp. TaxID=1871086 RepID=UPI002735E9FF|nr:hypothetical protein [Brevundimonas sp.]MDP3657503.1 hypothetical protein [Brevundimonas sp.]